MDLEKLFGSLDHKFLLCVLKKFGFGDNFITQYFTLKKGAQQVDPISAYLFIIALEVLFTLIKSRNNINGINLYDYSSLFTAYADGVTFSLKDIASVKILVNTFKVF